MKDLLSKDIPKQEIHLPGFLEIINKQTHENINSSVYAFFLNSEIEELKSAFLQSLLDCIETKTEKRLHFQEAKTYTEFATKEGRIDLLVVDQQGNARIIIENKIYHWLHNNLLEYWEFIEQKEENKIGVLLTLEPQNIPEKVAGKFINITHKEWTSKIKEYTFSEEVPLAYKIYVSDFIKTIENLSKNHEMNSSVRFYFENAKKILDIQNTITETHQFLNNHYQLIADKIGWQTYGNAIEWKSFWDEKNSLDTYLTINTKPLLEGNSKILIILELMREDKARCEELHEFLKDDEQFKKMKSGEKNKHYYNFAVIEYEVTPQDLERFSDFVVEKIKSDFAAVTWKAINFFYKDKNKDFSAWEEKFLSSFY